MFIKKKGGGMLEMPAQQEAAALVKDPAYLRQALAELRERDPDFSEDLFISRINNMFIQLQEAWQAKDWKKVRPFESDELFNQHARQLQELIDSHTTNVVDDIGILRTEISDYHDNGATESLDVYMRCRYKDYIVDDNTGKVVEGDPNREYFMEYELVMSRKKGVATRLAQNTVVSTCPNCGANVSINASGECEYCNSVVSNGDFDWVLTRLVVLSQN
jgi:predicted lipid-binding transport protein (Tim44 family)